MKFVKVSIQFFFQSFLLLFAFNVSANSFNNAIQFNGLDTYASRPSMLTSLSPVTMEIWAKWNGADNEGSTDQVIMYNGEYNSNGYGLAYPSNQTGKLWLILGGHGSYDTGFEMNANEWYHLAVELTGSRTKVYADGQLIYNTSELPNSLDFVELGPQLSVGGASNSYFFAGEADEFRIWSKNFTGQELILNGNHELNGNETDLVGYWRFSEINGDTSSTDATVNGNNLHLYGSSVFVNSGAFVFHTLPPFSLSEAEFEPNTNSEISWGDFDNDGDMDFAISGTDYGDVYRNDGNEVFTRLYADLRSEFTPSVAWTDVNLDGNLDIVLVGPSGMYVYYGDGEGGFNEYQFSAQGLSVSLIALGDYDGDGDADLFVSGNEAEYSENGSNLSFIFKNINGTFTPVNESLPGVYRGSAQWIDFDNDGDLDLFYTGAVGNGVRQVKLYTNDGFGNLTDYPTEISGFARANSAWGDYDNDGDLDLLMMGTPAGQYDPQLILYRNDQGSFVDVGAENESSFDGIFDGEIAWLDYDHDGDLDFVLLGKRSDENSETRLYKNVGDNTFLIQSNTGLVNAQGWYGENGSLIAADYDNDGDLDLLIDGSYTSDEDSFVSIFRNNTTVTNNPPTTPTEIINKTSKHNFKANDASPFNSSVDGNNVDISWPYSYDDITPQQNLSYNVLLQNENGKVISAALADEETGKLKVPKTGNAGNQTFMKFRNIPKGNYVWKVQAIDEDFLASEFSLQQNFSVTNDLPPEAPVNLEVSSNSSGHLVLTWNSVSENIAFYKIFFDTLASPSVVSDTTSETMYELSDVIVGKTYYFRITAVDSANLESDFSQEVSGKLDAFSKVNTALENVSEGNGSFADYDRDGKLDVMLSGYTDTENGKSTLFYKGDGEFNFSYDNSIQFAQAGKAEFVDQDHDGFTDVLITGFDYDCGGNGGLTELYSNTTNGEGTFWNQAQGTGLDAIYRGSVAWGDFNHDGFEDAFVTGFIEEGRIAKLFKNNGDKTFSEVEFNQESGLQGVHYSTANFVDVNNDGWLDIFYMGATGSQGKTAQLLINNGDETFTPVDIESLGISPTARGNSAWGDFDNDGDLDLLITGTETDGGSGVTKIYVNNGDNSFSQLEQSFSPLINGWSEWGDLNNDGLLDFAIIGGNPYNGGGRGKPKGALSEIIIPIDEPNFAFIYFNNGDGTFTESNEGLTALGSFPSIAFGDIDNDGDLDILTTGEWYSNSIPKKITVSKTAAKSSSLETNVYINLTSTGNSAPNPPTEVSAVIDTNDVVTISWNNGSDNETPSEGLSYNLNVWSQSGKYFVRAHSDPETGKLYLPKIGNVGESHIFVLSGLPEDFYHYSIQSVDHSFQGSSFTETGNFTIGNPLPAEVSLFTGKLNNSGAVNLVWKAETETNNSGWEIERKSNTVWKNLGFVKGRGTSTIAKNYNFEDRSAENGTHYYRLKQIDLDGKFKYSDVIEVTVDKPLTFSLGQNYPNPFNPKTVIPFSVASKVNVSLKLYDILGREIKTMMNEEKDAGNYFVDLEAVDLSSGVYFYKIQAGNFTSTKKLFLMK